MGRETGQFQRINAWAVDLPMRRPFTSARTQIGTRRLAIIRLETDRGAGWGEAAPVPGHNTESFSAVWDGIRAAAANLAAGIPAAVEGLAGGAISQAIVDGAAHAAGFPLWRHLGGQDAVWASAAIGLGDDGCPDLDRLEAVAERGYRHAKLKITADTDAALLRDVAANLPGVTLGLDANESLDLTDMAHLGEIDTIGFAYIEQPGPADDLAGHHRLKGTLETPIALDESAFSASGIEQILQHDAADIINLKVGRFGPLETLRLAKRITAAGCRVRLGGLVESGIGRAHNVALASHPLFSVVGDVAGSDLYFDNDLVQPSWRAIDGRLAPLDAPGIGVTVDTAAIDRFAFDAYTPE